MASLSYIWNDQKIPVEVLDFYTCGHVEFAAIEALEGKPFTGGLRYPVRTPFAIVAVDELIIEEDDCTCFLPEQSCPKCRAAGSADCSGCPDDVLPYSEETK